MLVGRHRHIDQLRLRQVQLSREFDGIALLRPQSVRCGYFGVQTRSFTLPQDIDDASAQATYKDGILELTLPKKPGSAWRQLQVQ